MRYVLPAVLVVASGLAGCSDELRENRRASVRLESPTLMVNTEVDRDADVTATAPPATAITSPYNEDLLRIANEYLSYQRIGDAPKVAPAMCAAPPDATAQQAKLAYSNSNDGQSHGKKVYYLYVKEAASYLSLTPREPNAPSDQVIVKQSWHAEPVAEAPPVRNCGDVTPPPSSTASTATSETVRHAGILYHAGRQGPLFIMYKTGVASADTDNGWIYGTVSADGKTVTSAGRVATCMQCHADAPYDRQFGVK